MPVIGLIGGIGSGKSLVAARLAEQGAAVLDADQVGHALLDQRPAREAVLARFGPEILDRSQTNDDAQPPKINRNALGAIVFHDPTALRDLERILHPRMRRTFEKAIGRVQRRDNAKALVLDAAILLEAGWDDLCDLIVFVDAPEAERLRRLAAHRGWTVEQLRRREQSQRPLAQKRARADFVLENQGDLDALRGPLENLWKQLESPPPRPSERLNRDVPVRSGVRSRDGHPPRRSRRWGTRPTRDQR